MNDYYSSKLSAEKLRQCYDIAPQRVRQYLQAEIDYSLAFVRSDSAVLELGCGYGRVMKPLAAKAGTVTGIDTSPDNLKLAKEYLKPLNNCRLLCSDASRPALHNSLFDLVICIQNGISAFHIDKKKLITTALALTCSGGKILLSSYAEKFWDDRLRWFRLQAAHGLIGEIDQTATGNGVIVCRDGFTAETVDPELFRQLAADLNIKVKLKEVDNSSLFCTIEKT